jgi:hypothetical protein
MSHLRHALIPFLALLALSAAGCTLPVRTPGNPGPAVTTTITPAPSGAPAVTIIPKDFTDTPGPTTAPDSTQTAHANPTPTDQLFDRKDPDALIAGLRTALQQKDAGFFARFAPETLNYVDYIEGGQPVSRAKLLDDLDKRFAASSPQCAQYGTYEDTLQVWTKGWAPLWQIDQICYQGCTPLNPPHTSQDAAFFFRPNASGEYELNAVWLNDDNLWRTVYQVEMHACSEPYQPQPTPTVFACLGAPDTRLKSGDRAYASTLSSTPNRLRSAPDTSADIIGLIQPRQVLELLDGPQCAEGYVWWKVRLLGLDLTGWTAEGSNSSYWLEPCTVALCGQP